MKKLAILFVGIIGMLALLFTALPTAAPAPAEAQIYPVPIWVKKIKPIREIYPACTDTYNLGTYQGTVNGERDLFTVKIVTYYNQICWWVPVKKCVLFCWDGCYMHCWLEPERVCSHCDWSSVVRQEIKIGGDTWVIDSMRTRDNRWGSTTIINTESGARLSIMQWGDSSIIMGHGVFLFQR